MTHRSLGRATGWLAAAGLAGAALVAPSAALATAPAPDPTVTICHAGCTDADPSPAVESVDPGAAGERTDAASTPADPSTPTDPSDPGEGTFVVDPTFVTPTPSGIVLGTVGTPGVTPPPTDTLGTPALAPGGDAGIRPLLLVLAGLSILALVVGRVPGARR